PKLNARRRKQSILAKQSWIASALIPGANVSRLSRAMTVFDRNYCLNSKISGRDFGERRLERGGRARQIREGKPAIRGLLLRFRRGGTNLRDRLPAIEHG